MIHEVAEVGWEIVEVEPLPLKLKMNKFEYLILLTYVRATLSN